MKGLPIFFVLLGCFGDYGQCDGGDDDPTVINYEFAIVQRSTENFEGEDEEAEAEHSDELCVLGSEIASYDYNSVYNFEDL